MKKSFKALGLFVLTTIIYSLFSESGRFHIMDQSLFLAFGYVLGASVWFVIPGMINFWINDSEGYIRLMINMFINFMVSVALTAYFFDMLPANMIVVSVLFIMAPVTVSQLIIYTLMGLRFKRPVKESQESREQLLENIEKIGL